MLADTADEELDSKPANIHRQKTLLGRLTPRPLPTVTEIAEQNIQKVYNTSREPPEGVITPRIHKSPWTLPTGTKEKAQVTSMFQCK